MNDENLKNTTPLEVGKDMDEFDTAILEEQNRTKEAQDKAEYYRKKYAAVVNENSSLKETVREKDEIIESKNSQILQKRSRDRYALEQETTESKQKDALLSRVVGRIMNKDRKKLTER